MTGQDWTAFETLFKGELQKLQLPISEADLPAATASFIEHYQQVLPGIEPGECVVVVSEDAQQWVGSLESNDRLSGAIKAAFESAPNSELGPISTDFTTRVRSFKDEFALQPSHAIKLVANLRLIRVLATDFHKSGSVICQMLQEQLRIPNINSDTVSRLIEWISASSQLDRESVRETYETDAKSVAQHLADAEQDDLVDQLNELSAQLGVKYEIGTNFARLRSHDPYVQMLHYQCAIAEHFDSSSAVLYEHSPRGAAAGYLFELHQERFGIRAGNPFLNNAKSVYAADFNWALQKKNRERGAAVALVEILEAMDALPHAARKRLAWSLRLSIIKLMEIGADAKQERLARVSNEDQLRNLLNAVASKNSQSRGVLEQRLTDYVCTRLYRGAGYRLVGRGDSVNASNCSRKKTGDVEAINAATCTITAYEPHGGRLSGTYAQEHIRTLAKIIDLKRTELELVAPLDRWSMNVTFVAHSSDELKLDTSMLPIATTAEAVSFKDFFASVKAHDVADFNTWVIDRLNRPGVSVGVRKRLAEMQ